MSLPTDLQLQFANAADVSINLPAREPIAIVGIGCRYPGADGPEAFWRLLIDGVDAVTEFPAERFDLGSIYDPRPQIPGKISTRWAGLLPEVDRFDPYFFGITPREAMRIEPQQRLALEVAWAALEDAGITKERLLRTTTGVFLGLCTEDYSQAVGLHDHLEELDIHLLTGTARSVAPGRIAYWLGLEGPTLAVDAACASSLLAVHLACQSIWQGESTMALAGGVNVILHHEATIAYSRSGMLARDGRCKFGDASADGFVRGEGAGMLVLKPLSRALADGDQIYATIRGGGSSNDGQGSGALATPSRSGQEAALRAAYASAGISPGQVSYVEAHGTGTIAGDPVEIEALAGVLCEGRVAGQVCLVGSVKTNFGHTEAAAGVAGVIKTALALKHGVVPPSLHFREPNPAIAWETTPLRVVNKPQHWPRGATPRIAGVNSFGISGANVHLVMEEAPPPYPSCSMQPPHALVLSAHTPEALGQLAHSHRTALLAMIGEAGAASFADWCYTAAARRTHHRHRLALVARTPAEAAEALEGVKSSDTEAPGLHQGTGIRQAPPKLVWVFSGNGGQWIGMGQDLLAHEPVFRAAMQACDVAMLPELGYSIIERLRILQPADLDTNVVIAPLIFALQVAFSALWRSWGIEPDAVIGHSMGEIAAAYVAGALSLDDAAKVICRRSNIVARSAGEGTMLLIELPEARIHELLTRTHMDIEIAAINSPVSTIVAGTLESIDRLVVLLDSQKVFSRRINSGFASHCSMMDPLAEELREALAGLDPRVPRIAFYSTVMEQDGETPTFDAAYWFKNIRRPVRFAATIQRLVADGFETFLEMSPHPVLLSALRQSFEYLESRAQGMPTARRQLEYQTLLDSLCALYVEGHSINWRELFDAGAHVMALPPLPLQRERYWLDLSGRETSGGRRAESSTGHPLLQRYIGSAADPNFHLFETTAAADQFGFVTDHRVLQSIVLPGAAVLEMALAAAHFAFGSERTYAVENVALEHAVFFPAEGRLTMQLVVRQTGPSSADFRLFSRPATDDSPSQWKYHHRGTIRFDAVAEFRHIDDLCRIQARCPRLVDGLASYEAYTEYYQIGPSMRTLVDIASGEGEALGRLVLPAQVAAEAALYYLHPALLDGQLRLYFGTVGDQTSEVARVPVPVQIGRLIVHGRPNLSNELWGYARVRAKQGTSEAIYDTYLLDAQGNILAEAGGLVTAPLQVEHPTPSQDVTAMFLQLAWAPQALVRQPDPNVQVGNWLIFADGTGIADALIERLERTGSRCLTVRPGHEFARPAPGTFTVRPDNEEDYARLWSSEDIREARRFSGILHFWSANAPRPREDLAESWDEIDRLTLTSVLFLIQLMSRRPLSEMGPLWLITTNTQAVGDADGSAVEQSPLWGFVRSVQQEQQQFALRLVDLSDDVDGVMIDELTAEVMASQHEAQVALRRKGRFVARLRRPDIPVRHAPQRPYNDSGASSFRLAVEELGMLDTLRLREEPRCRPRPGEVEIKVSAVGLNFRDVLQALGFAAVLEDGTPAPLGKECSGVVVAVGHGVERFAVGDTVIAFNPAGGAGLLCAFATLPQESVFPKPAPLDITQAATTFLAYLTAYYTLHELARMQPGERVLIHAAAGGVGLAAVNLAQRAGAEIYATAGSEEKRAFLRTLGIRHVFDSRSLAFADDVLHTTGGEGVDIVLNSLSGEFIPKGLSILRPYGRFLEIGKRDIHENTPIGLGLFKQDLSFFSVDLGGMIAVRPAHAARLMDTVLQGLNDGSMPPLPLQALPISRAEEAFRIMANARHIGRIALTLDDPAVAVERSPAHVRSDVTYLITGGLRGIGLAFATWLADKGARHLLLIGRSAPSEEAERHLAALQERGVQVRVARVDVSNGSELADEIAAARETMPPLGGVIHSAVVIDDGIVLQLDPSRSATVLAPKRSGAWNLHLITRDQPLDFFILFSSFAGMLGVGGQSNYAAANVFLDALAAYRRQRGLPALTISWGPWAEVGLAVRTETLGHLARFGWHPLRPREGFAAVEYLLGTDAVQVGVGRLDADQWYVSWVDTSWLRVFEGLLSVKAIQQDESDALNRTMLRSTDIEDSGLKIEAYLVKQVAAVAACPVSRIDMHTPLNMLGIDSLMAVELANRIKRGLDLTLPVTDLLRGPTVSQLAALCGAQLAAVKEKQHTASPARETRIVINSETEWEDGEF